MTRGLGGRSPANITYHLQGVDFPARRDDLVAQAQANDAEAEVMEIVRNLPDQEYESMADVTKGIGEVE
ncbi:MAG: DUF2795 domain-containing protein [Halomonas sp.]|jgi:putative heme iron utilization protein|uniref:DUF2795 domain-containing protein n=1 Tax=Billgrantia tianxiuensis TaxID=2497861 RepID=A0A6I6SHG7_9GAMM|nr:MULTISPECIES: DUF2795 domain-containing protein [Halomonas]MCE8031757.1 DUF2795 domain-containing protein [Halomonas sp. MCCC 1A11057]MDX5433411.1 DUF2795 domain-containing protein [Halomonas sp.]QHC50128.1 DUF2795 domain-containing protein [Halomonas tianxiuensis]